MRYLTLIMLTRGLFSLKGDKAEPFRDRIGSRFIQPSLPSTFFYEHKEGHLDVGGKPLSAISAHWVTHARFLE